MKFYEEETFFEGAAFQINKIKHRISVMPGVVFTEQKSFGETEVLFVLSWAKEIRTDWSDLAKKSGWECAVFENITITDFENRQLDFLCNDVKHRYFDFTAETTFAGKTFNLTKEIPAPASNELVEQKIGTAVKEFSQEIRNSNSEAYEKINAKMEELLGKKMIEAFITGN